MGDSVLPDWGDVDVVIDARGVVGLPGMLVFACWDAWLEGWLEALETVSVPPLLPGKTGAGVGDEPPTLIAGVLNAVVCAAEAVVGCSNGSCVPSWPIEDAPAVGFKVT